MKLIWAISALLLICWPACASTAPVITADPTEVVNQTSARLRCNLTDNTTPIKGSHWTHNGKIIQKSVSESPSAFMFLKLDEISHRDSGTYECVFNTEPPVKKTIVIKTPPYVTPHKQSEHGNENDKGTLSCLGHGHPLPTDWIWFREEDGSKTAITNGTSDKYEIQSTPEKSTLIINNLSIQDDAGIYVCLGTSDLGSDSSKVQLRVRSRLAALWPFLGILAEVIILVTVIFIYEKRRKPDEVIDDDDLGSAPLKSNSPSNHKDKNVRQRNSN